MGRRLLHCDLTALQCIQRGGERHVIFGDELCWRRVVGFAEVDPLTPRIGDRERADDEIVVARDQTIEGQVELTEALGSEIMAHFSIDAPPAITDEVRELQEDAGTNEGGVGAPAQEEGSRTIMVGRFGARSKANKDQKVRVAVDTRALHFFDPATGLGIYDGREGARG